MEYLTDVDSYETLLRKALTCLKNIGNSQNERYRAIRFLVQKTDLAADAVIDAVKGTITLEEEEYFRSLESEDLSQDSDYLVAPRTFSLRADDGRVMYSNVFTRKCSERRTFMRGGTALNLYVEPGALRGHHWRTMLKTMYADKLPSKFDLYHARGKVDMAALVDGNVHGNMTINKL